MPDPDDKTARIVASRVKLMERFRERMEATPALADPKPRGSGPPNRHGMPRLPVGQVETKAWPVLDLGVKPDVSLGDWRLVVDGAVERPTTLDWPSFVGLEQATDTSDFHCVTTWSKMDLTWEGVRVSTIAALVSPREDARHLLCHAFDGYTTNVPLEEALKPDVLLAHRVNGAPLPRDHGGPVRMITPQLYAWKGAKWIRRLEFLAEDQPGFWERRGYSNTAHPWRNDRYAKASPAQP